MLSSAKLLFAKLAHRISSHGVAATSPGVAQCSDPAGAFWTQVLQVLNWGLQWFTMVYNGSHFTWVYQVHCQTITSNDYLKVFVDVPIDNETSWASI